MSTNAAGAESPTVESDTTKKRPRLYHIRCCKAAVPKGLCRGGRAPKGGTLVWGGHPNDCVVCDELWWEGHYANCPRDSGYWEGEE